MAQQLLKVWRKEMKRKVLFLEKDLEIKATFFFLSKLKENEKKQYSPDVKISTF